MIRHPRTRPLAAVALLLSANGCAAGGRLGEFDFRDRALAVVLVAPPQPDVLTGKAFLPNTGSSVADAVLAVGSQIVRQHQANQLRDRLDEAIHAVDVSAIVGDRTLDGASSLLRMRPVESSRDADFEVEVRIRRYGIQARDWDAQASFFLQGEVLLVHSADGSVVWKTKVDAEDPVSPDVVGLHPAAAEVVTASVLAGLSTEQMEDALTGLAQFSADRAVDKLGQAYDKARR